MRTSFPWSALCQRIVPLLSQRRFSLPAFTAPGDSGFPSEPHTFPIVSGTQCRVGGGWWRGCRWFNFRFFAFAWDLCPPGGTKGRQGVRTWLHFYLFPILYFWASSSVRGSTPALPCRPREQVTGLCRTSLGPWASVPVRRRQVQCPLREGRSVGGPVGRAVSLVPAPLGLPACVPAAAAHLRPPP